MRRFLGVLAVVFTAVMLATPPAHADTVDDEAIFVAKINDLRAGQGLAPLAVDAQLTEVARSWAAKMAGAADLAHNPNLTSEVAANWSLLGENVGTGATVDSLHQAFVASSHHYENLVEPRYQYVGIGVVRVAGTIWVAEEFMALKPAPTASPTGPATASAPAKTGKVCKKVKRRTKCTTVKTKAKTKAKARKRPRR